MMEGSFSMESVRAHEQVIAEQRNTLIINMTRKRMPKAMHKYNNQGGLTPQSVHTDSTSANNGMVTFYPITFRLVWYSPSSLYAVISFWNLPRIKKSAEKYLSAVFRKNREWVLKIHATSIKSDSYSRFSPKNSRISVSYYINGVRLRDISILLFRKIRG